MNNWLSAKKIVIAGADSEFLLESYQLITEILPSAVLVQHCEAATASINSQNPDLIIIDEKLFERNREPDFTPFLKLAAQKNIRVSSVRSPDMILEVLNKQFSKNTAVLSGLPVERRTGFSSLEQILNTLPFMSFVLDSDRRILFCNTKAEDTQEKNKHKIHGLRPGEFLGCVHSLESFESCGTMPSCSVCGLNQAVNHSLNTGERTEGEARLNIMGSDGQHALNVLVEVNRLLINCKEILVIYLEDISDLKRRRELERIFFHDIINTAGGIKSLVDFLSEGEEDPAEVKSLLQIIRNSAGQLLEEIRSQKDLAAAETNELKVNYTELNSLDMIKNVAAAYSFHQVAEGKKIKISEDSVSVKFKSDEVLLNRILGNLLKNALEAGRKGDEVEIGCHFKCNRVVFTVKNQQIISPENQYQIFQRSFSTKGNNRGIGTYSIKLLTEKYLNGKAFFVSNETEQTVFSIELLINAE